MDNSTRTGSRSRVFTERAHQSLFISWSVLMESLRAVTLDGSVSLGKDFADRASRAVVRVAAVHRAPPRLILGRAVFRTEAK
jgi:hypothetical protein